MKHLIIVVAVALVGIFVIMEDLSITGQAGRRITKEAYEAHFCPDNGCWYGYGMELRTESEIPMFFSKTDMTLPQCPVPPDKDGCMRQYESVYPESFKGEYLPEGKHITCYEGKWEFEIGLMPFCLPPLVTLP